MKLKISLKSQDHGTGSSQYKNEIDASDYRKLALVLMDLANLGIPIDKALRQYSSEKDDTIRMIIGN